LHPDAVALQRFYRCFPRAMRLTPVAGPPNEDDEDCDNSCTRKHPVLAVETKNAKFLNEEVHARAPLLGKLRGSRKKIYYFYTKGVPSCAGGLAFRCRHGGVPRP
jgi:hypothetical protein